MLRQIREFVVVCLAVLAVVGLLSGVVSVGYLLGWLIVIALFALFVPKAWQPKLKAVGTVLAVAVLICMFQRWLTSIYIVDGSPPILALLLVSLLAYFIRKFRHRTAPPARRLTGAERTPVLPTEETIE
jgi:hypothetical protein